MDIKHFDLNLLRVFDALLTEGQVTLAGKKLNRSQNTISAALNRLRDAFEDPLFVRAGSMIPIGSDVESTHKNQSIAQVRIYPGADANFTLFSDDGTTYAYEKGAGSVTHLHWNDATHQLTHEGPAAWSGPDNTIVKVEAHP